MFSRLERILIALMVALVFAGVTLLVASAGPAAQPPAQASEDNCLSCHPGFDESWKSGPHALGTAGEAFNKAWTEQGQPTACLACHTTGFDPATGTYQADGITCISCHNPVPADHPNKDPMPVNKTADLCITCHSGGKFGVDDWQSSAHYRSSMTCSTCHDPHTATLRKMEITDGKVFDDASDLCVNCHREYVMDFPYSKHHTNGLTCIDCHLKHYENADKEAHAVPDHSFKASVETCNQCHGQEMHGKLERAAMPAAATEEPTTVPAGSAADPVNHQPAPVSPYGFAALAGLLGLAAGVVLAPWLDRAWRHASRKEERHE
jgi:predicted CXXCH cytochrome family protein